MQSNQHGEDDVTEKGHTRFLLPLEPRNTNAGIATFALAAREGMQSQYRAMYCDGPMSRIEPSDADAGSSDNVVVG